MDPFRPSNFRLVAYTHLWPEALHTAQELAQPNRPRARPSRKANVRCSTVSKIALGIKGDRPDFRLIYPPNQ